MSRKGHIWHEYRVRCQEPGANTFEKNALATPDDFGNFLARKVCLTVAFCRMLSVIASDWQCWEQGTFGPPQLKDDATFQNGMRLV